MEHPWRDVLLSRYAQNMVEDSGVFVPIDRQAADLEPSSDEMKRAGVEPKEMDYNDWDGDLEADYQPEEMDPEDDRSQEEEEAQPSILPSIAQAILPRPRHEERERTPRRELQRATATSRTAVRCTNGSTCRDKSRDARRRRTTKKKES